MGQGNLQQTFLLCLVSPSFFSATCVLINGPPIPDSLYFHLLVQINGSQWGQGKITVPYFCLAPFLVGLAAVMSGEAVKIKILDNKTPEAFVSS